MAFARGSIRAACVASALATTTALGGCQIHDRDNKLVAATLAGAAVGSLLGWYYIGGSEASRPLMIGLMTGAVGAGAYFLADSLLPQDEEKMQQAAYESLENDRLVAWQSQDSGNAGSFEPIRSFTDERGRLCRDYQMRIAVDGEEASADQTACQLHDGAWQVI